MTAKMPRHEVAPALQAMMLDWLDKTADWDETDGDERPRMLFVYRDRMVEMPLPPRVHMDTPRVMIKKMADVFERCRRNGELGAPPPDLVGLGALMEFWSVEFETPEERDQWRRRNFAEHPRAVETRILVVHQPGYAAAAAMHERDRRGAGVELRYPLPMMSPEPLRPGGHALSILVHLERAARAVLAPPATFLSGR